MNDQTDYNLVEPYLTYLDRIQKLFPALSISQVETNVDGLVNDVLVINRERVFRFPKADWASADMRKEAKILALAGKYLDMRLPVFDHQEDDFVSYRFIPGEALRREKILTQDERTQDYLAEQLARFLRQLHNIPAAELERHHLPPSGAIRSQADYAQLFESVRRELFPLFMTDARAWATSLFEPVLADQDYMSYQPALIHGDLASYHILYDPTERQINSVIDFGTAGIGDPANDFACLINSLGETFLRRMARFYPEIGQAIERARFMAGVLELEWALGGVRSKDLSWFMVHIGRARDMMPLGSGWPTEKGSSLTKSSDEQPG
jgi:aminoglycoside 2''-phosphotransferase